MVKKTLEETLEEESIKKTLESLTEKLKENPYTIELEYKGKDPYLILYKNEIIKEGDKYILKQEKLYEEKYKKLEE